MQITEQGNYFKVQFKYSPWLIEKVKAELPGRRYDRIDKCWMVPVVHRKEVEAFAHRYNFQLGEIEEEQQDFILPPMPQLEQEIPLKRKLFDFQGEGVAYILEKKRTIVGDEPGLGKTGQSIAGVQALNAFPCLVICPASLKENWKDEWALWTEHRAMILESKIQHTWDQYFHAGLADVFIVNYESLKKYFVDRIDKPDGKPLRLNHITFNKKIDLFKSVIIDESHRVKELRTQQTKFTKGITTGKDVILALTGTPVINKPKDLISQLGIIDQMSAFGNYKKFVQRYCNGPNEASNLKELNYLLRKHCFYRRRKSDVLKDLPAKVRQIVHCDITNRREYAEAEANMLDYLKRWKNADDEKLARAMRGQIMVKIGILKNIAARGKLKDVFDYVDDIMESGEKLILFGHLKEVLGQIKERYPDCVSITGDDNTDSRERAKKAFQEDPKVKLIVCSIKAAGVGLTLTASSRVAFVEFPWHAADCDQCEDRAHRIGQKDSVQCTYFLGRNTFDETNYKIIETKREIANMVTGDEETVEVDFVNALADLFSTQVV